MRCKICRSACETVFTAPVLGRHEVAFHRCIGCGFLQVEDFFWKDEAYQSSINDTDTGILERSLHFARVVSPILYFGFGKEKRFLDWGGGYGIFTRRMRDIGFDFYWQDPYSPNLLAKGYEFDERIGPIELITAFECFEHFEDPVAEVADMAGIADAVLFSTSLLPNPLPQPGEWPYYGFEHGQHIAFYTPEALARLGESYGWTYHFLKDNIHLLTRRTLKRSHLALFVNRYSRFLLQKWVQRRMQTRTYRDEIEQRQRCRS